MVFKTVDMINNNHVINYLEHILRWALFDAGRVSPELGSLCITKERTSRNAFRRSIVIYIVRL